LHRKSAFRVHERNQ